MPSLLEVTAISILDACLDSELGIIVRIQVSSNEREVNVPTWRARQLLYRFKKDNPNYSGIQIRLSPDDPDNELWLLRYEIETNDSNQPTQVLTITDLGDE